MKLVFALSLLILLISSSCTTYNRVLKSDDYDKKFSLANTMYEKGKWLQSIALYEQVYQRVPKTGEGEVAYFRIGRAYYEEKDYYMAGYYYGSFFERFTHSKNTEEAYFMRAICSVKSSPNYSLDQRDTDAALAELQQFIYLFPNSTRIDTCNRIMDDLRFKIEKKEFEAVRLYSKTMYYRAAVVSSENFLKQFPNSSFKEEALYIHVKNATLLALNSIDTKKVERIDEAIESYRTFVAQYPSSKHSKEVEAMNDQLQENLKTTTNSK